MKIGTKSILFGVHQFAIHPFLVFKAWRIIYGQNPTFRELVCIIFHDVGYWGCADMDGEEGTLHPLLGGRIVFTIFGLSEKNLVVYHSRKIAMLHKTNESKLCAPDKLSMLLYPTWLYLILGKASGEITEYKLRMQMAHLSDVEWLRETRRRAYGWAYNNVSVDAQHRLRAFLGGPNIRVYRAQYPLTAPTLGAVFRRWT